MIYTFLFFLISVLIFFGGFWEAPWCPTRKKDFERIAELARIQPNEIFYDIGSGMGEILFYLSKKYNINCVGIEISPIFYLYSKIKSLFYDKVKIHYGDFYKYDLSKSNIIYIFLLPKSYDRLKKKLDLELKKRTKIIFSCWPLENYKPDQINKKKKERTYYLYTKK